MSNEDYELQMNEENEKLQSVIDHFNKIALERAYNISNVYIGEDVERMTTYWIAYLTRPENLVLDLGLNFNLASGLTGFNEEFKTVPSLKKQIKMMSYSALEDEFVNGELEVKYSTPDDDVTLYAVNFVGDRLADDAQICDIKFSKRERAMLEQLVKGTDARKAIDAALHLNDLVKRMKKI
jgi:hypothetical protein